VRARITLLTTLLVAASSGLTVSATGGRAAPTRQLPLRFVADVPLPGGSSRFDYQSLDPSLNRLYISHLAADAAVVFDVKHRRVRATIAGLPGVHGVLVAPGIGRVYAAATDARELVTIDEQTGAVVRRIPAGSYPDGIAYDPVDREVFVSDESSSAVIVADARSGRRLGTIDVGGEAGNLQYDPGSGRILVDVQRRNQLVAIDPKRKRIVGRYPLPGCQHDHGLHLDPARRLAFVACDGNATLLVLDLRTGRVLASAAVGDAPDVLDFDPGLRRLYVAAESGVVTIFAEHGRRLIKLGQAFLADEAHSVAVDPRTHLVYFPLQGIGGRPVLRIMQPTQR
jgi:DNA-binding beta-propeller fold protein YncE